MIDSHFSRNPEALSVRLRRVYHDSFTIPTTGEPRLAEALRETLGRPGNLIRAELAFQVAGVYGVGEKKAEHLAVALEYFHTASLLFDDLPSMDDALHRRGAVCIHHLFGEGTAILGALALINRAYALAWAAMEDLPSPHRKQASRYLERYLGLTGILDGQSRDINYAGVAPPGAALKGAQRIALEKTVSLIRLPLVLPAMMAGASARECGLLHRLAMFWGLGYQALDDLKDVLRDQHEVGKTTGRDQLLSRPNVALELGLEATVARLQRLATLAEQVVSRLISVQPQFTFLTRLSARFDTELQNILATSAALQDASGAACCS